MRLRTVSQTTLNIKQISETSNILPTTSSPKETLRRRIAAVEKLKAAYHASLSELDALLAVLRYRAFLGDL